MTEPYTFDEYNELVQIAIAKWKLFLKKAKGVLADLELPEFIDFKQAEDVANEYYKKWTGK